MDEKQLENAPMDENERQTEPEKGYVPRPAYQVWAARIGLVVVIIGVILYYLHIAQGGL